jgi:hypothetical protein
MIRIEEQTEKVCENCRFSKGVWGLKEPTLICENKAGAPKKCIAVKEDEACRNFEYSRDIVTGEIAAALAEGARLIPLTQDKFAIVDAEDYERLSEYKWHTLKNRRNYYARNQRPNGAVLMHRVITNAPRHLVVDHINHNGLDNRKENLRLCTVAQNSQNARPRIRPNLTSRYKGVSFDKNRNRFKAYIQHKKIIYNLGRFEREVDAAKAYDKKARELFGEFAYLNFPDEVREETSNIEHRTPNVECGAASRADSADSSASVGMTLRLPAVAQGRQVRSKQRGSYYLRKDMSLVE